MNMQKVAACWRRGFAFLIAIAIFLVAMNLLSYAFHSQLPKVMSEAPSPWLVIGANALMLLCAGPFIAWGVFRIVIRDLTEPGLVPMVPVARFSDETSASIAAAVLGESGIESVVSSGSMGLQTGLPVPAGGVPLLVSVMDHVRAAKVLADARVAGVNT